MSQPSSEKFDMHSEAFLHNLTRRQLKLSIACAATFMIALLGLPMANYFFPELMATRVFGFTLTWFILGVLFFPFVWIISYIFIKRSIALEEDEVKSVQTTQVTGAELQIEK
jgi:uncharacterized membrane protein (DUF485 family)